MADWALKANSVSVYLLVSSVYCFFLLVFSFTDSFAIIHTDAWHNFSYELSVFFSVLLPLLYRSFPLLIVPYKTDASHNFSYQLSV